MQAKDLLDLVENYRRYRIDFEPRWYTAIHAYENEHFMAWSRTQGQLVKIPFRKRLFHQLPEVSRQADALENLLLATTPVYVAYPNDFSSDKDITAARYISLLLKEYYNDWHSDNLFHEYVHDGIVMPYSFLEIKVDEIWDEAKKDYIKDVRPVILDAFDILFDPRYNFDDNNIIIKILKKPLRDFLNNPIYKHPKTMMVGSEEVDFKEMLIRDKYGNSLETGENAPVTAYECLIKEKKGLRIQTIDTKGFEMRNDFYEGIDFFPIVPFRTYSGNMMQPSYVERILPINRAEDIISNRIEDFIYKMVRGAYLKREGSELNFDDETGSIVSYEGDEPTVMPIPTIPDFVFNWFQNLQTMTERYTVSSMATGQPGKGSQVRAAKIYEQVQRATVAQQKTPIDNFFYSLQRAAEITLYYLSTILTEPRDYTIQQVGGKFQTISFIGEDNADLYPEAIVIPKKMKRLHVEIEDSMGYTIEGKRNSAMEIAKVIADVPEPFQEIILDLYKVGNTADIMSLLAKSKTLLNNPEFMNLIAQKDKLPPEVRNGLAAVLQYLSKQSPVPSPSELSPATGNTSKKAGGKPKGRPKKAEAESPQGVAIAPGAVAPQPPTGGGVAQ